MGQNPSFKMIGHYSPFLLVYIDPKPNYLANHYFTINKLGTALRNILIAGGWSRKSRRSAHQQACAWWFQPRVIRY